MTRQKTSIPAEPANTTPKETNETLPKRSGWHNVISTIGLLLGAPLVAIVLITFVFQSFQVDGQSMERSLQNGDRLIVWKVPRTLARLTNNDYIPKRGDVIVFNSHTMHRADGSERQLVKRVIGLPGERVVVKDGRMTIYNQEHPEGFNPDNDPAFGKSIVGPTEHEVDITVPAGEVFVSGDNRTNSTDSRTLGTINSHDIIGRMVLRILPVNKFDSYL